MALFGFTVIFIFLFLHDQCSAIDFATARDDATAEEQKIANCYKNCGATGCDERPTITTCDEDEKYRTIDGTCNNIDYPYMGAARTHYDRLMTPKYEIGSTEILRTTSIYGDLPFPRDISNTMTSVVIEADGENGLTLLFMTFGQLIAHDTIKTPSADDKPCCPRGVKLISSNPNCLPIKIPDNDPHFDDNVKCHKFIRSLPDGIRSCETGYREQLDGVTQFIDGSAIYGSSQGVEDALRDPTNGKLIHSDNGDEGTDSCKAANTTENRYCHLPSYKVGGESFFAAGDSRAMANPGMTSITTVFARFHNFISDKFKVLGIVDREENYQKARRIVGACFQSIAYGEYLPLLLGQPIMSKYGLKLLHNEYSNIYNGDPESPIHNEFSTASFRFGHSQAPGAFELSRGMPDLPLGVNFDNFDVTQQQDQFPSDIIQGTVKISNSALVDQFLEPSVTNTVNGNMDLYSFNIKRGRDHGIPPYMEVRKFCELRTANTWEELENLGIIKPVALALLRNVYRGPDEIELFPGGLSEEHVKEGVVGPTFACTISETFRNLKQKDRFFFDAKHNPYPFTKKQLEIIKKTTIASIICEFTTNLDQLKQNAFLLDDAEEIDCDILRQGTVLDDISEFLID